MFDKEQVKYYVESGDCTLNLLYLLLKESHLLDHYEQICSGDSAWAGEGQTNLVSFLYAKVDGELYCFYEPTAVEVNWIEVETCVHNTFPNAKRCKAVDIYFRLHHKYGEQL